VRIFAPGKLFWLGEYVVLDGAPAIVAAVDAGAEVTVEAADALRLESALFGSYRPGVDPPPPGAELAQAVFTEVCEAGLESPPVAVHISTESLHAGSSAAAKLGLGSSSAVAAGLAVALAPGASAATVEPIALGAHRCFQGGRGSGADVLAALHGGLMRIEGGRARRLAMPAGLQWVAISVGHPADTRSLLDAVSTWRDREPAEAESVLGAMRAASRAGADALERGDVAGWLAAVESFWEAERALSRASGAGVVDAAVEAIVAAARAAGWVAKPSGAGGGDVVVAFAGERGDRTELAARIEALGCSILDVALAESGALGADMNSTTPATIAPALREPSSRIPGFYRLEREARVEELVRRGFLEETDAAELIGLRGLSIETADAMIENVVGLFALPLAVAVNFRVNGRELVVPMAVEEPSIVAAVSHAANLVRRGGGFDVEADRSIITGQIQVVGLGDLDAAAEAVRARREELLAAADALEPGMRRRGGGAVDVEVRTVGDDRGRYGRMLVVHVYVDACDAMGANLINTICEGLAPRIEELTGGTVFLRILSNLTDRRRVRARCRIPAEALAWQGFSGDEVADGVVAASEFAAADPYRAATHNKGIMNGVDAVAVACGQDWRAIEAGAHAWAGLGESYAPLARWHRDATGALCGELDMPLAVGVVGGTLRLHPTARIALRMLGARSASELACVMGAVGLAQNLAAIKALGSTGIQRGHMALHARSVAALAGAEGAEIEAVARAMVDAGVVKTESAVEALRAIRGD
jgi:hydroxymethylglutaryl-CoA reductase